MSNALEPDDDCMIHGGWHKQPRCSYCGRFLGKTVEADILDAAAKHGYFGSIIKDGNWLRVNLFDNNDESNDLYNKVKDIKIYGS